jgi:hypothetical protein
MASASVTENLNAPSATSATRTLDLGLGDDHVWDNP